jgi:hypothetical protein
MTERALASIDPEQNPGTIDFKIQDGPLAGKTQLGIYRLLDAGKTLQLCVNIVGSPRRPTRFTTRVSADGGGDMLLTYTRSTEDWETLKELVSFTAQATPDGGEVTLFSGKGEPAAPIGRIPKMPERGDK